ncbi:AAA family ATPase [Endozoicomonas sp. SM1973]|uniref:AAA family ATPase n=1 Tax=Spartinivicinus marinus TaxID=2994442 RepID=A0A853I369_9GAMM|nr:AAA family ATPase [Spartinivicinus marinus]MCX4029583.1 AAA family ATPase [Spartinivicinus marinus]NYZ65158.1 AAA family ATPase [Spartinivicinus marinus]
MSNNQIIFLNGVSSSGKSSIAKQLQKKLINPYFHLSIDSFLHAFPDQFLESCSYMKTQQKQIMSGFHSSVAAVTGAGNRVIVDHIMKYPEWLIECADLFHDFNAILVKVYCPLDELEKREKLRGDREIGTAKDQFNPVYNFSLFDIEIDTSKNSIEESTNTIIDYIESDNKSLAFDKLREQI